jgi:hypothetical protein
MPMLNVTTKPLTGPTAGTEFFADALVDEDIGVNRYTQGRGNTGDPRQCQGRVEHRQGADDQTLKKVERGHFTIRRLERTYGGDVVRAEYDQIKPTLASQERISQWPKWRLSIGREPASADESVASE